MDFPLESRRIMFTVGSVGRHYRSALGRCYRSTLSRYVGRVAVHTRLTYRPRVGRMSAECRSSIGQVSVDMSADTRLTLDQHPTDTRPISFI